MEKVMYVLRADPAAGGGDDPWCAHVRGPVAAELLDLDLPGLTVNVKDAPVRDSVMTLSTFDPPVSAVVSVWTQQSYGRQPAAAVKVLEAVAAQVFGYLVTESVPLAPPEGEPGSRTTGLANIALLRRPPGLDEATWRHR